MLFNSFEFMLFLPIVFLLYWKVFKKLSRQNLLIVVASYIFYGWWNWRFLFLILITTLFSYGSGLAIEHFQGNRHRQKMVSIGNIILNVGILAIFKYYNFFVESLQEMLSLTGIHLDWPTMNIILPVGISFYTFQALSYSIDVYRGKIQATHDLVAFFAFISFFPQLVAGPIERATNLLPQFIKPRKFDYDTAVDGCRQILWGFFKKCLIADVCAMSLNNIWMDYQHQSGLVLLNGAILFTFQIYGDFSGYSDIAIGTAKLFGIRLLNNFNYPYFSRSIPEFWRRWHISLMTWFRDYIYFPLGGSRCPKWKTIRNTFIVFGISGLWHGANWTFVSWGLYHACILSVFIYFGIHTKHDHPAAYGHLLPNRKEATQMLYTFILVAIGWVIFRAESLPQAWDYISRIFTAFTDAGPKISYQKRPYLFIFVMLVIEWLQRTRPHGLYMPADSSIFSKQPVRWCLYIVMILTIMLFKGAQGEFIYFQF